MVVALMCTSCVLWCVNCPLTQTGPVQSWQHGPVWWRLSHDTTHPVLTDINISWLPGSFIIQSKASFFERYVRLFALTLQPVTADTSAFDWERIVNYKRCPTSRVARPRRLRDVFSESRLRMSTMRSLSNQQNGGFAWLIPQSIIYQIPLK